MTNTVPAPTANTTRTMIPNFPERADYPTDAPLVIDGFLRLHRLDKPLSERDTGILSDPTKPKAIAPAPPIPAMAEQSRVAQGGYFQVTSVLHTKEVSVKDGKIAYSARYLPEDKNLFAHDVTGIFSDDADEDFELRIRVYMKAASLESTLATLASRTTEDRIFLYIIPGHYGFKSSGSNGNGYHQAFAEVAVKASKKEIATAAVHSLPTADLEDMKSAIRAELEKEQEAIIAARVQAGIEAALAPLAAQIIAVGNSITSPDALAALPIPTPSEEIPEEIPSDSDKISDQSDSDSTEDSPDSDKISTDSPSESDSSSTDFSPENGIDLSSSVNGVSVAEMFDSLED